MREPEFMPPAIAKRHGRSMSNALTGLAASGQSPTTKIARFNTATQAWNLPAVDIGPGLKNSFNCSFK